MIELNHIYCMDCLEGMRQMEDKSVDLVITDPPYGIGESNEQNATRGKLAKPKDYGHYEWDSSAPTAECFAEIFRISNHFRGQFL